MFWPGSVLSSPAPDTADPPVASSVVYRGGPPVEAPTVSLVDPSWAAFEVMFASGQPAQPPSGGLGVDGGQSTVAGPTQAVPVAGRAGVWRVSLDLSALPPGVYRWAITASGSVRAHGRVVLRTSTFSGGS